MKDFKDSSSDFKALENQLKATREEKESLTRYNLVLQDQATKYALLHSDEKKEKMEILGKYENLQAQLNQQIKDFTFEKLALARKYYFLVGITVLLIIGLGVTLFFLMYA